MAKRGRPRKTEEPRTEGVDMTFYRRKMEWLNALSKEETDVNDNRIAMSEAEAEEQQPFQEDTDRTEHATTDVGETEEESLKGCILSILWLHALLPAPVGRGGGWIAEEETSVAPTATRIHSVGVVTGETEEWIQLAANILTHEETKAGARRYVNNLIVIPKRSIVRAEIWKSSEEIDFAINK